MMTRSRNEEADGKRHWSLDRRIPLALIVVLVMQSAAIIYWAAGIEARVEQSEDAIDRFRPRVEALERGQGITNTAIARVEERLEAQTRQLDRIEQLVERLLDGSINSGRK